MRADVLRGEAQEKAGGIIMEAIVLIVLCAACAAIGYRFGMKKAQ
jgi:hypothetical protein